MPDKEETLADAYFRAQRELSTLEDSIYMVLRDRFENGIEDVKSADWYDNSIEFWATKGTELDEHDQKFLALLGFRRCWLNVREGTKADETYYVLPRPAKAGC